RQRGGEPFFLAVGFKTTHLPFSAPKKYWDLYDADAITAPDEKPPQGCTSYSLTNYGELRNYYGIPDDGPLSPELARQLIHGYYACVSYLDAQVGRVMDELDRLGLRDQTIVVLCTDHAMKLGEHGA